mgnify:CR=1 FL=1|jgi:hypothetical protein
MQHENLVEPNLYDFLITGPRKISLERDVMFEKEQEKNLSWINPIMWADLKELSKLLPFN